VQYECGTLRWREGVEDNLHCATHMLCEQRIGLGIHLRDTVVRLRFVLGLGVSLAKVIQA